MAYNIGLRYRTNGKPLLRIVRGVTPEQSKGRHESAPVAADETIYSGHVMYKVWNGTTGKFEWTKGGPATWGTGAVAGDAPLLYWAYVDAVKEDVVAANSLVGLPCSGDYVLSTPYFTGTAANFIDGAYITYDGNTGSVKLITGFETANEPIIGQVVRIHGAADVSAFDISGGLADQDVVTFQTLFLPNLADAT